MRTAWMSGNHPLSCVHACLQVHPQGKTKYKDGALTKPRPY